MVYIADVSTNKEFWKIGRISNESSDSSLPNQGYAFELMKEQNIL